MIVQNPDDTLTLACDVCGIGCPEPLEGHLTPRAAIDGAERHRWTVDLYGEHLCPSCALAVPYPSFTLRYMTGAA